MLFFVAVNPSIISSLARLDEQPLVSGALSHHAKHILKSWLVSHLSVSIFTLDIQRLPAISRLSLSSLLQTQTEDKLSCEHPKSEIGYCLFLLQ